MPGGPPLQLSPTRGERAERRLWRQDSLIDHPRRSLSGGGGGGACRPHRLRADRRQPQGAPGIGVRRRRRHQGRRRRLHPAGTCRRGDGDRRRSRAPGDAQRRRRLSARRRCAPRAGTRGGAVLPAPARDRHRRDRHERQELGHRSASLGTLGVITSAGAAYGSLTTPDPVALHETLDRLAGDAITHLAMEASSHGIEQRRLDGVRLKAAGFTNLGRDHLDYHGTIDTYRQAKLRLFEDLLQPGTAAVVNADGDMAELFLEAAAERGLRVLTTGRAGDSLTLLEARAEGGSQKLRVRLHLPERGLSQEIETVLPLIGAFQVENALLAAGLVIAVEPGAAPAEILAAFPGLKGVPGRLETIGAVAGAVALVDYAHKPEALAHVLDALRPFAKGRLVCVFGCGGDRDKGKRPIMGAIAAEKADIVIVTDDNPRSEAPAAIRAEILAAAPGAREIGDRAEAIGAAVRELRTGDVLVVAGKGHETGQIVGDRTLPFSDHEALRAAIAERSR